MVRWRLPILDYLVLIEVVLINVEVDLQHGVPLCALVCIDRRVCNKDAGKRDTNEQVGTASVPEAFAQY